jgi:hypothetical protein
MLTIILNSLLSMIQTDVPGFVEFGNTSEDIPRLSTSCHLNQLMMYECVWNKRQKALAVVALIGIWPVMQIVSSARAGNPGCTYS